MKGFNFTPQPGRLSVCVIGPGFGESVIVGLPDGRSWIVVDGAAPENAPPAVRFLESVWLENSSLEMVLLTHPHSDHSAGLGRILDHPRFQERIQRVGCVCEYLGTEGSLAAELTELFGAVDVDDPEAARELGRLRTLLARIGDEWNMRSERAFSASNGLTFSAAGAQIRVLGPTRDEVRDFFRRPDLAARLLACANDLSVVLEVRFGETLLLLGGDLPRTRGGTPIASGWDSVARRFPDLHRHHGYKIAHHASIEAVHPAVVCAPEPPHTRTWIATPYNKGERLPNFGEEGGFAALLAKEPRIALTGLPVGIKQQVPMPGCVRRHDLTADLVSVTGLEGIETRRARRQLSPCDCYWIFEHNDRGQVVACHRGPAATMVTA